MLNPLLIQTFERRLIALQLPAKRRQRAIEEMSEHREDLINAAREEGLSEAEASMRADRLLGDPTELADQIVVAARRSSLWGRHPVFSFCVLPFLGMIVAIVLSFASVVGVFYCIRPFLHWPTSDVGSMAATLTAYYADIEMCTRLMQLFLTGTTAFLFCRLTIRSAAAPVWMWIACLICAVESYIMQISIHAHSVIVGNILWTGNVVAIGCALFPFAIALSIQWRQRSCHFNKIASIAAFVLLPLLSSGCATQKSEKPPHIRAWIGGEYHIVKKTAKMPAFPAPYILYRTNFPKCLPQTKAIYVAALATNSPAYHAGLRTNDYLAEWNGKRVTSMHQFRSLLNKAPVESVIHAKIFRDNQPLDLTIHTGTEKFYNHGCLVLTVPSFVEGWDLWPDPGFSLVFLGYEPKQKIRRDLNSAKELSSDKWHAWCAIFELSASDQIVAQTAPR
jgi:hypothetical protein